LPGPLISFYSDIFVLCDISLLFCFWLDVFLDKIANSLKKLEHRKIYTEYFYLYIL